MSEELFKKREIKEEKRENHIYISISQVLSYLSAPFDQQGVAKRTYENNFNNPESQYYQKTIEEIIEMCFPLIPNIIIFIFQLINSIIHYFIQQTITMSVIISTSSLNS